MTSVVIAAHNEAAVIGACLDRLLRDAHPDEFEVIVAANGCTDDTAAVAGRRAGVTVLEVPQPGKARALNRADSVATRFPRMYLDADIPLTAGTIRALSDALDAPSRPLVAVPARRLELRGRPVLIRAYFAVQSRLPVFEEGLFGRGLIAVSRAGRERFEQFPEVIADDLFLDSVFSAAERVHLAEATVPVATPRTTRDLVRRLVRVRRGNAALRSATGASGIDPDTVRPADRLSWLRDVVVPRPWLAPAAVVYVAITAWAALLARRGSVTDLSWGRDESSRQAAATGPVR